MARRAKSSIKGQTDIQNIEAADVSDQVVAKAPRRGRMAKVQDNPPAEMSVTDAFFPGGDEPMSVVGPGQASTVKARGTRKPKFHSAQELPTIEADRSNDISPSADAALPVEGAARRPEVKGDNTVAPMVSPPRSRRGREIQVDAKSQVSLTTEMSSPTAQPPAAKWDADKGTATFDWPVIELVASTKGPNRAMAKLLLAARAEGANSRWPF